MEDILTEATAQWPIPLSLGDMVDKNIMPGVQGRLLSHIWLNVLGQERQTANRQPTAIDYALQCPFPLG